MIAFHSLSHDQQLPILLDLAKSATALYDLPQLLSVKLINLSENATYKLEAADSQCWALRIHRDGYHSSAAIASELAWLMDLKKCGVVTTPEPVKGRDGQIIQRAMHPSISQSRHIVLTRWESGSEPGIDQDLIEPFKLLGEVTARMHLHSKSWKRPPWFERLTWDFESALGESSPHWGRWRDGVGVDTGKQKLFDRTVELIGKRLLNYGKQNDRFGLAHCDLRLANLLMDDRQVKVMDFDDCGFGWYMYDAATALSFYEHEPQVPELIEAWKEGYRRVAVLHREDEVEIPTFIMLRRLLLVAWIGSHGQTDLGKSTGDIYTAGTVPLCEAYLRRYS
jgi:Ser/Thr protein kinase RdoA (MazF antagonist)